MRLRLVPAQRSLIDRGEWTHVTAPMVFASHVGGCGPFNAVGIQTLNGRFAVVGHFDPDDIGPAALAMQFSTVPL